MKFLIMLSFLSFQAVAFSAGDNCEGLKHPDYMSEYNACKKIEAEFPKEDKNDSCGGLKHPKYMTEYNACKEIEKKLFMEGKKGKVCGLIHHQDATYKAANKIIADPKEGLENYEAGTWYNDWDKSSDNYVPVYDKADHSKAQLVKVSLDSDCKVTEVSKSDNKNLLKYLLTVTESAKKNKVVDHNCESVDEQTAVCAGNLYKRDKSTTNSLKRDLKKIDDYVGSDKAASTKSTTAK